MQNPVDHPSAPSHPVKATSSREPLIIFAVLGLFVALTAGGVAIWGPVALAMAALILVPVVMVLLVVVTFG